MPIFPVIVPGLYVIVLVNALATGSGPTAPNKSDPISTTKVEVLAVPKENGLVDFEIKDLLRSDDKRIFDAFSPDFRVPVRVSNRE